MRIDIFLLKKTLAVSLVAVTGICISQVQVVKATGVRKNYTLKVNNDPVTTVKPRIISNSIRPDKYILPSISLKLQSLINSNIQEQRIEGKGRQLSNKGNYTLQRTSDKLQEMINRANNMHRQSRKLIVTNKSTEKHEELQLIGPYRVEGEPKNTAGFHGRDLKDFDLERIGSKIIKSAWYLQYDDTDGQVVTHISSVRPKVVLSNGKTDADSYVDLRNKHVFSYHKGEGKWISGRLLAKKAEEEKNSINIEE